MIFSFFLLMIKTVCRASKQGMANLIGTLIMNGSRFLSTTLPKNASETTPLKLELFMDNLANQLHMFILRLFPKTIAKVEDFHESIEGLGRI